MTRLVCDIGNTWVRAARVAEDGAVDVERVPTADFVRAPRRLRILHADAETSILSSCVHPEARQVCEREFGDRLTFIKPERVPRIDFSPVDTTTLGQDRIANAAAAEQVCGIPPWIVIDCGTAVTIDVVDEKFRFAGGAILPGRSLQRRALHLYTGQLPELPMDVELPQGPGVDTRQAMILGIDAGLRGAVRSLLERFEGSGEGGKHPRLLLTGGDAQYLYEGLPNAELMSPIFTLNGLAAVAERI